MTIQPIDLRAVKALENHLKIRKIKELALELCANSNSDEYGIGIEEKEGLITQLDCFNRRCEKIQADLIPPGEASYG